MARAPAAAGLRGQHQTLLVCQEPGGSFGPIRATNGAGLQGRESQRQCQLYATWMARSEPGVEAPAAANRSLGVQIPFRSCSGWQGL